MTETDPILTKIVRWCEGTPGIIAAILTSSRAVPGAPLDEYSDYDVILILDDIRPFWDDRGWLLAFGEPLAVYRDPLIHDGRWVRSGWNCHFRDGFKIDFTLWPPGLFEQVAAQDPLPPEFDAGYHFLFDRTGLGENLAVPTCRGYIPERPTEVQFRERIESFLLDAMYVGKCLYRDDPVAAHYVLENHLRIEHLIPTLEWIGGIESGWTIRPGPHGRRLKSWLRPDLWADLQATYSGLDPDESWAALFRTIDLFRKACLEVADDFGFVYPVEIEADAKAVLHEMHAKDRARRGGFLREKGCIFCDIVAGESSASRFYEDETVIGVLDIAPVTPGHAMIIPKKHAAGLADLDEATGRHVWTVAQRTAAALRETRLKCEGVNLFLADGEAAFQEIFHVHLHVFPRFKGDAFRIDADWSVHPSREELDRIAEQIRAVFR